MGLHGFGPAIAGGVVTTLMLAASSLAVACALGLAAALAKLSPVRAARAIAAVYTTLIRGVPELVLLLAVFYGGQYALNLATTALGRDDVDVPPVAAGIATIGFIFGAYLCETFRGAILAIPAGQAEAARAFGFSRVDVVLRITLPQMVRHALPGFTNTWLVLVKATALVSIVGLDDMVHRAGLAASATREPFTFYLLIAAVYLAITSLSLAALARVERRYSLGVRRAA